MRFLLIPGRTNKQGVQINVGKDEPAYQEIVTTLTMHADDMKELGVATGAKILIRNEVGEATFICKEGNIPRGMLFVPYGPPTCQLMGGATDAWAISLSGRGVLSGCVSLPSRYIHSAVGCVHLDDLEGAVELILAFIDGVTGPIE